MTHQIDVSDEHNLVVTVYRDTVTADEIECGFETLAGLARDRNGLRAICDFTLCRLDFSTDELRALASRSAKAAVAGSPFKRAILVADDLTFGIGRMFCAFSAEEATETRTFRDIGAVAEWLDIDRDVIARRLGSTDAA